MHLNKYACTIDGTRGLNKKFNVYHRCIHVTRNVLMLKIFAHVLFFHNRIKHLIRRDPLFPLIQ